VALGGIEEGGIPVRRVALSTPEQGKGASAYRTVNVGLSSSYDLHVSYIFVAAISICPPLQTTSLNFSPFVAAQNVRNR
jgi:hypothetical protein